MRNFFRRQRAVNARPAHVLVDGAAERFLRYADLQRSKSRFVAHAPRKDLVNRRTTRTAARVMSARHQSAHRRRVSVTGGIAYRGVVHTAQDVDVIVQSCDGRQTARDVVVWPRTIWNPVTFRNAVAVEPQNEAPLERRSLFSGIRLCGVRRANGIEH